MYDVAFEATCRVYSKVLKAIATDYDLPMPSPYGARIEAVRELVFAVFRQAYFEGFKAGLQIAANHLPGDEEVLYIPPNSIDLSPLGICRYPIVEAIRVFRQPPTPAPTASLRLP